MPSPDTPDPPDAKVARVASRQFGVFTLSQAQACGVSPRMVRHRLTTGRWVSLHRGVYVLGGAPVSYEQRVFAATAAAPGSVASHRSAGVLWKLEGVASKEVEILTEHGHRAQLRGVITHRTRSLGRSDRAKIGAIPVTRPIRTLIDLASVLSADALEDALDDALRRLVPLDRLMARLLSEPHRGRRGIRTLVQLVQARTPKTVAGSGRENAVRRALVKAGLPEPVRQYEIFDESGRFVARVDLAYPQARVYIEYDGVQHADLRHWERDLDRQNRLSELDWLPLRFTKGALARSDGALVERVKSVLGARNDNHGA